MLSQTGSLAVSFDPASLRAVYLACYREICPTADRANLIGRAAALSQQGGLQHRIEGKYRLLKIPAVPARPPFTQHIAGAVQRQASIFRIIVRAPLHQPADRRPFGAGQLAGRCFVICHSSTSGQLGPKSLPPLPGVLFYGGIAPYKPSHARWYSPGRGNPAAGRPPAPGSRAAAASSFFQKGCR